jgi:hypothetical protein
MIAVHDEAVFFYEEVGTLFCFPRGVKVFTVMREDEAVWIDGGEVFELKSKSRGIL